ncbi:MAG: lipoprotein-releasing system permease protein, partial [Myxococcota bacterium]
MSEPTPLDDPSRETVDFSKLPPIPESGSPRAAEWWLAQKHLRSKKGEAFLSLVTVLSIVGVVAGVAILNWVIGVMTGFEVDLRDKILGANAHVITRRYSGYIVDAERVSDSIEEIQGVRAAAPFVYGEAMIRTPGHEGGGVVFKGLDPERHGDVTALMSSMDFGPDGELTTDEAKLEIFRSLAHPIPPPEWDDEGSPMPGIIIGRV